MEKNKNSKTFQNNLEILKESLIKNRPVSFKGRNLHFRDTVDYSNRQEIEREAVQNSRRKKSELEKLEEEIERLKKEKKEKQDALEFITNYFAQF